MPTNVQKPLPHTEIKFTKLVAAGNDFILIDAVDQPVPEDLPAFSVWACERQRGIGADGVLLVRRDRHGYVRLQVINPDGSIARMCGNGARCAAFYAMDSGSDEPLTIEFSGRDEVHIMLGRRAGGLIELTSPKPRSVEGPVRIDNFEFYLLDTGTEYAVAIVDDVDSIDVPNVGRMVRYHPRFKPNGLSVSFAQRHPDGLKVRTYERGNEA
jgi:diaminopimelate epimerase